MTIPHLVQYQGSKRRLASQILPWIPAKARRLVEPFSRMAAISLAAANANLARNFLINDINRPLTAMLQEAVNNPERLGKDYKTLWKEQFAQENASISHFYLIREKFNSGQEDPAIMLYLLARCVKGSIRYGKNGKFNQSPDKRRHGTNPDNMARNIMAISSLLKGKTRFSHKNYAEILEEARPGDIVYMDPPY